MAQGASQSAMHDSRAQATQSAKTPEVRQDRSVVYFLLLAAGTAFFATMLLVDGNLFIRGWRMLLSLLLRGDGHSHYATLCLACGLRRPRA